MKNLKNKLFLAIICVLILNIVLSGVIGSSLFDRLYTYDKITSLKSGVKNIKTLYLENNINATIDEIIKFESQNMDICIFSYNINSNLVEIEYYSRQRYFTLNPFDNEIINIIKNLYTEDAFKELEKNEFYIKNIVTNRSETNIAALTKISSNRFILMQTPLQFIKDISDSAIKYSLYISIFSLLIVAIVMYYFADKTTKPIRQLQLIADKISKLDFSERSSILSKDEVGLLSLSINNMADKLQDYVAKLKDELIKREKTDKMTKQLIANISHDFKTPLTLIMSYSEALQDLENDDETKNEYISIIINEGRKMSEFVQELLKLSQLEGGMIALEKSNFSINEIIEDIINKNSILAKEKNIEVLKEINDISIVNADYFRIEQVFQNLYENAIKYCEFNGIVRASTKVTKDNKCRISIFNSGKHIINEDIENIFLSFYRADKSRSNLGSYGLGLAIVKVILDMHNQSYGVKNVENGVEFWFELDNVETI